MRRAALALAALPLLGVSCEHLPASPDPPRVLAVDLLDNQDPSGGGASAPVRRRLYDGAAVQAVPESGPDLSLRVYLSAPLSAQSVSDAPSLGVLLRDGEGLPVTLRSLSAEAPDAPAAGAPEGAQQALTVLPDLRSGRRYILALDRGYLVTDDMTRLEVPPPLAFQTARRFVVLRVDPDGPKHEISQVRLTLSSPIHRRPSGVYGVVLTAGGKALEATFQLSGNGRQLTILPICPLPEGQTQLTVPTNGVEEDDTLTPLAAEYQKTLVVDAPQEVCTETLDMAGGDLRDSGDLGRSDM